MERCGGFAAVFTGDDERGYRYILGSRHLNLRPLTRDINLALNGRGGGRPEMIQGQAAADEAAIRRFCAEARF